MFGVLRWDMLSFEVADFGGPGFWNRSRRRILIWHGRVEGNGLGAHDTMAYGVDPCVLTSIPSNTGRLMMLQLHNGRWVGAQQAWTKTAQFGSQELGPD